MWKENQDLINFLHAKKNKWNTDVEKHLRPKSQPPSISPATPPLYNQSLPPSSQQAKNNLNVDYAEDKLMRSGDVERQPGPGKLSACNNNKQNTDAEKHIGPKLLKNKVISNTETKEVNIISKLGKEQQRQGSRSKLLRSGDIEMNPGPSPRNKTRKLHTLSILLLLIII